MGTEVITLSLQQVGWQVFGAISVEEGQRSAESRHGNARLDCICNHISPASLSIVDGLVEEVVEEKILEVRVVAVSRGDVLQEYGSDDAPTTPHEGNRGLVELPAVLLGSLQTKLVSSLPPQLNHLQSA